MVIYVYTGSDISLVTWMHFTIIIFGFYQKRRYCPVVVSPPLWYFPKILQSLENGVVAFVGCECSSGMHVRGSVDDRGANVILTVRDPAASGKPRPHSLHSGPDGAENNGHRDMRHC